MPRKNRDHEKSALLSQFFRDEKRAPSYSEMLKLFGYRSKNAVYGLLQRLEANELIERSDNGHIIPTDKLLGGTRLLGSVQAGFPSPAEEELVDTINLDEYLIRQPEATFLLTVSGESMTGAGIFPNDLILIEKGGKANIGDIVVAQVDGEWTLKYFGRDNEGVFLDPANPAFRRIRPQQSMEIGGVVTAVIRKF